MNFQMGAGCTYCNLTGYRGRAAIYELLEIDRPLADAIRRGDSMEFANIVRQREAFTTLADAALDLVADRHHERGGSNRASPAVSTTASRLCRRSRLSRRTRSTRCCRKRCAG